MRFRLDFLWINAFFNGFGFSVVFTEEMIKSRDTSVENRVRSRL